MLVEAEEKIDVSFVGRMTEDFEALPEYPAGFAVVYGNKSCFLPINSDFTNLLEEHDDDLLEVFLDCLLNSNDENAIEFSDEIRSCESSFLLNGEEIFPEMITESLGALGEKD